MAKILQYQGGPERERYVARHTAVMADPEARRLLAEVGVLNAALHAKRRELDKAVLDAKSRWDIANGPIDWTKIPIDYVPFGLSEP